MGKKQHGHVGQKVEQKVKMKDMGADNPLDTGHRKTAAGSSLTYLGIPDHDLVGHHAIGT